MIPLVIISLIFIATILGMMVYNCEQQKKDLQARLNTAYQALQPSTKLDWSKRQLLQQAGE